MASNQLFGRAWDVQVLTNPDDAQQQTLFRVSSSDQETQSLRVVFDVTQSGYSAFWQAELDIFNPNTSTVQQISEGCQVSIAAGYAAEGIPGEIFRGRVYQAIWTKQDANTTVLRLLCFVMLDELTSQVISATYPAGVSQRQIIIDMAKNASTPIPVAYIAPDSAFTVPPLPRSLTLFGKPQTIFANIADENELAVIFGVDGVSIAPQESGTSAPDVIYSPPIPAGSTQEPEPGVRYSLIGTPLQTPQGVAFRTLLDPRLNVRSPYLKAQLKNAIINGNAFELSTNGEGLPIVAPQSVLDASGTYLVQQVRFLGDTRGDEWEAEVIGMVSVIDQFEAQGGNQ